LKTIEKSGPLIARVAVPPSKSFTARALLLATMTEGRTTVRNALDGDDSRYMLEAIRKIGFEVEGKLSQGVTIGERLSMSAAEVELFIGNAGTAMRFLTGFLTFTPGRFLLTGEARMHERPIADLVDALHTIDAEIEYAGREGYPPLRIRGKRIRGGFEVAVDGSVSSQYVSSLMLAGAGLGSGVDLRVLGSSSRPYIEITREILTDFGARIDEPEPGLYSILPARLQRDEYVVEGDYSSASYWIAAAAVTGGEVTIEGLREESVQGDRRFLEIAAQIGCSVSWDNGAVTVKGPGQLAGGTFDFNDIPDLVPTLAAIAPAAAEPIEIVNVANLRVKESDRLAVVASELRKLGAVVEERADSLRIEPGWSEAPATIETHGDHRIAMAFAVAGLARGSVTISGDEVVSKSYPRFWRHLDEVTGRSGV
jgi:3-phosphoshikimate 1-carboxyvinyltransferase